MVAARRGNIDEVMMCKARIDLTHYMADIVALNHKLRGLESDYNTSNESLKKIIGENIAATKQQIEALGAMPAPGFFAHFNEYELDILAIDVEVMLIQLAEFYQTDSTLLEGRAAQITAQQIVCTFKYLTLEDIAVVINDAMKGKMGTIYGKVNGPKVMEWLQSYQDRMNAYINEHSNNRYDSFKAQSSTPLRAGLSTFKKTLKLGK